jgi:hypothetical protein
MQSHSQLQAVTMILWSCMCCCGQQLHAVVPPGQISAAMAVFARTCTPSGLTACT